MSQVSIAPILVTNVPSYLTNGADDVDVLAQFSFDGSYTMPDGTFVPSPGGNRTIIELGGLQWGFETDPTDAMLLYVSMIHFANYPYQFKTAVKSQSDAVYFNPSLRFVLNDDGVSDSLNIFLQHSGASHLNLLGFSKRTFTV